MWGSWRGNVLWSLLLLHSYIYPLLQCGLSLLGCNLSGKRKTKKSGPVFQGIPVFSGLGSHISPPFWVLSGLQGICVLVQWSTTSTSDFGLLSSGSLSCPCTATPFLPAQCFFCPFLNFSTVVPQMNLAQLWPTMDLFWSFGLQWVCTGASWKGLSGTREQLASPHRG